MHDVKGKLMEREGDSSGNTEININKTLKVMSKHDTTGCLLCNEAIN